MSLFGALFTAVSGMSAQSQATAMISNNIANVDTVGFKGSDAAFYSLVTSATNGGQYSPGTVDVNRVQNVTQQGAIQQTSSGTDAAITGNGFFTVARQLHGARRMRRRVRPAEGALRDAGADARHRRRGRPVRRRVEFSSRRGAAAAHAAQDAAVRDGGDVPGVAAAARGRTGREKPETMKKAPETGASE